MATHLPREMDVCSEVSIMGSHVFSTYIGRPEVHVIALVNTKELYMYR